MPLSTVQRQRALVYGFVLLLGALVLLSVFGDRGTIHLWRLWGEKRKLDEKNFLLQQENETLRERISRLRRDDFYLEKVAREELGLARPGDVVYRFRSSKSKAKGVKALSAAGAASPRSSGQKSRP